MDGSRRVASPRHDSGPGHEPARRPSVGGADLRCLVVDDHQLVAQAVGGLLSELCGLELQAVCTSVRDGVAHMRESCPDLLILDLCLPGESWQEAAEVFLEGRPNGALVVLSAISTEFVPPENLEANLLGVVDKTRAWQDLAGLVSGWTAIRQGVSPMDLPLQELTPRELRVFLLVGRGLVNKEIAHELGLSLQTVETYRKALSHKLGISGAELVRAASLHRCVATRL